MKAGLSRNLIFVRTEQERPTKIGRSFFVEPVHQTCLPQTAANAKSGLEWFSKEFSF